MSRGENAMPIHDWTRVDHGTFHDFHQGWATQIRSALNNGILPPGYEAKVEQHTEDGIPDPYTKLRKTIAVRQENDRLVALIEIVSPGKKSSRHGIRAFVRKVTASIEHGLHVLIIDLFPPGPRDPNGIHPVIWSEFRDEDHVQPADKPLTLVSYEAGPRTRAYVQPSAVGSPLSPMPLFLEPERYVDVPLEATYQEAFQGISRRTRDVLTSE
jgi:hypothetical protein